jgi:hypothetical protein
MRVLAECYRNSMTSIKHSKLVQSPTITLEHPNIEILLEIIQAIRWMRLREVMA